MWKNITPQLYLDHLLPEVPNLCILYMICNLQKCWSIFWGFWLQRSSLSQKKFQQCVFFVFFFNMLWNMDFTKSKVFFLNVGVFFKNIIWQDGSFLVFKTKSYILCWQVSILYLHVKNKVLFELKNLKKMFHPFRQYFKKKINF